MATKRRRKHAEDRALEILRLGRPVSDADLLEVLEQWRFHKNKSRQNVLPEGEASAQHLCMSGGSVQLRGVTTYNTRPALSVVGRAVFSDTLGLVIDRATKQIGLDAASRKCPSMLRLMAIWLRDRQPVNFKTPFPFTSISVNFATVPMY